MRCALAFGLLIALCVSADAAKVHHPTAPAAQSSAVQAAAIHKGFAVPGWTDQQTRDWMDSFHGGTD